MNELPENFNLKTFIAESKNRLSAILSRMQWSEEFVLQNDQKKANPRSEVIDEEFPLPASCALKNSITLDVHELRQVVEDERAEIPTKFSELQLNFTREQKLRIYEHIVACTGKCTEPEIRNFSDFAEIVAAKKREKKNKRRHRISKPTHIEEVRSLLELQMQSLHQYIENQRKSTECSSSKDSQHASHLEHSRRSHRSRSREYEQQHRQRSRSRSRSVRKSKHKRKKSHSRSREKRHHSKHKKRRSRSRDGSYDRKHSKRIKKHSSNKRNE